MGITISLCMIVKDEEENLEKCLSSVCDVVDEINIVDTGSTDRTVEIARQFTDRIFYFEWIDDFAAARNYSFSKATKDYIMWLDADDTLTPENAEKLAELKETITPDIDIVSMLYHCSYDAEGNARYVSIRERLLRRTNNFKWESPIHEFIKVIGTVLESKIYVSHRDDGNNGKASPSFRRNFEIIERIIKKGDAPWRMLYYHSISLFEMGRYDEALTAFLDLFEKKDENNMVGVNAYLAVFRIYMAKGEREKALNFLIDREYLLMDKSEYYCELGDYYSLSPETYDKAFFCYRQALSCSGYENEDNFIGRIEPCYYYVPLHSLGQLLIELQMYEEAIPYLEMAMEYRPNNDELKELVDKLYRLVDLKRATAHNI